MVFDRFISLWNNKFLEVTGTPQNQCVDLANGFIRDVLGQPIIQFTNAIDFPTRVDLTKYDYILNSPTNFPQKGDLVIWKPSPGHIAVCFEGDINRFSSYDENFPVSSSCHLQEHTYQNVVGWLRFKAYSVGSPDCSVQDAKIIQLNTDKATLDSEKKSWELRATTSETLVAQLQSKIDKAKTDLL